MESRGNVLLSSAVTSLLLSSPASELETQGMNIQSELSSAHVSPFAHARIPIELQEMVIRWLAPHGEWSNATTLAKSALVCRNWYHIVVQILYTQIQVFGRKSYKILENALKDNQSLGLKINAISIHDIAPAEHVSVEAFHPSLQIQLHLKNLFISGWLVSAQETGKRDTYDSDDLSQALSLTRAFRNSQALPKREKFTFPYRHSRLADLPKLKSLHQISICEIEFGSLDHLRRIFGAIPNLRSVMLRRVSWMDPEVEFKPLFDATSWQLTNFSLSHCSSNYVAPFFWAIPSVPNQSSQRKYGGDDGYHPPLCKFDVVPVVELAKFLVAPSNNVAETICWEWKDTGEENPGQWSLECCIDQIDTVDNYTYICFHFPPLTATSTSSPHRIVQIDICVEKQAGFAMDRLDTLLCEFQELERLQINFVEPLENCSLESVVQELPRLQEMMKNRIIITSQEPPVTVTHHGPKTCCALTKNQRADFRPLLLQSLYQIKDRLCKRRLEDGTTVRVWETILELQRELVLGDVDRYKSSLLDTLDEIARFNHDIGLKESTIKYATEAVDVCRQLIIQDPTTYTVRLAEGLDTLAKYLETAHLAPRSEVNSYRREALGVWRRLATLHDFERYAPRLANSLGHLSRSLHWDNDGEAADYRHEEVNLWRRLVTNHDFERHAPQFSEALEKIISSLSWDDDHARIIAYRREQVDLWRRLAFKHGLERHALHFAETLDKMASSLALDRHEEAIEYRREEVDLWRGLYTQHDDIQYARWYSEALNKLATSYSWDQHDPDAMNDHCEVVGIQRTLASQYHSDIIIHTYLAEAYDQIASRFSQLRSYAEAIRYRDEAIDVRRRLVQWDNTAGLRRRCLANSLHEAGLIYRYNGDYGTAYTYFREAADIGQEFTSPWFLSLSYSLHLDSMSWSLIHLGRYAEAIPLTLHQVCYYRGGTSRPSSSVVAKLELSYHLNAYSVILAGTGEYQPACDASEESLSRLQEIELPVCLSGGSFRYNAQLAIVLHNFSFVLFALGRQEQALKTIEKALTLVRELYQGEPSRNGKSCVKILRRYAFLLDQGARFNEADEANEEASSIESTCGADAEHSCLNEASEWLRNYELSPPLAQFPVEKSRRDCNTLQSTFIRL